MVPRFPAASAAVQYIARRLLTGLALCAAVSAHAGDTKIYRSLDPSNNTVTFSDHAIDKSSRLIAVFDGKQLWPRSGNGPVSLAQLAARRAALEPLVQRVASTHGVRAALLKAVIEVESGFDERAYSSKGAIGLMQVMPATAARYGQFDLYSAEQNIEVGARYLHDLLAMFDGNVRLAVAAYNAGENAVMRSGKRVPAYPETQRYVPMVLERYNRFLTYTN
jgi:soluble lytic murein transglycosylase-like protein